MVQTNGDDSCIVNESAARFSVNRLDAKLLEIALAFTDDMGIPTRQPCIDGLKCQREGRRLLENLWMSDDSDEFMDAWPWDCPRGAASAQPVEKLVRCLMKGTVRAVGIDEKVGIDGDQLPWPL